MCTPCIPKKINFLKKCLKIKIKILFLIRVYLDEIFRVERNDVLNTRIIQKCRITSTLHRYYIWKYTE